MHSVYFIKSCYCFKLFLKLCRHLFNSHSLLWSSYFHYTQVATCKRLSLCDLQIQSVYLGSEVMSWIIRMRTWDWWSELIMKLHCVTLYILKTNWYIISKFKINWKYVHFILLWLCLIKEWWYQMIKKCENGWKH